MAHINPLFLFYFITSAAGASCDSAMVALIKMLAACEAEIICFFAMMPRKGGIAANKAGFYKV